MSLCKKCDDEINKEMQEVYVLLAFLFGFVSGGFIMFLFMGIK
jgi:hypothetical protein